MRKLLVFLILSLYALGASGFSLRLHYCGGKLASLGVYGLGGDCKCKGNPMKPGCCASHDLSFDAGDDHEQSHAFASVPPVDDLCGPSLPSQDEPSALWVPALALTGCTGFGPPPDPLPGRDILILHRTLRV